jgi:hypothetical protein
MVYLLLFQVARGLSIAVPSAAYVDLDNYLMCGCIFLPPSQGLSILPAQGVLSTNHCHQQAIGS